MNRSEAYRLLFEVLNEYRGFSYSELRDLVGVSEETTRQDANDVAYLLDVSVHFDEGDEDAVVVSGTITPSAWGGPHDRIDEEVVFYRNEFGPQ